MRSQGGSYEVESGVEQGPEVGEVTGGRVGERGAHGPDGTAAQPGGRLHQRHRVSRGAVAQFDERHVEAAQQPVEGVRVAVTEGGEEGAGDFRREGVHGGGVGGDADRGVGPGLDLGGGGAVEEQEVVGGGEGEALEAVEVAVAVLEPDDVRQGGDAAQRVGGVGDLAALVRDERQRGAGGERLELGDEAVLRGGDQVVRQDEEGVGAGVLSDAREPGGLGPAVADAGDDGDRPRSPRR